MFTFVRGVQIPTLQIDNVEQEYGVKLVSDERPELLLALDRALQIYRLSHKNKDPDVVQLSDYPELLFKHMVLNISFMGAEIPGSYNKPAWFSFKRNHPIYKQTKNYQ